MPRIAIISSGDLDGFFGLFVDNLVQLLLIVSLCGLCGISPDSPLLVQYILPGAAVSIILGNLFYAFQAYRLARKEKRSDVTALPYGINTPSLLVYIFLVMLPAYQQSRGAGLATEDAAQVAWLAGLTACLGSGLIELSGAFAAGWIKRHTPRAALLSTLAGIAMGFISMTFALQIYQRPLVAMLPWAVILLTYFARVRFPLGLPGGLVAILLGTACAWTLPFLLPESIAGPKMVAAEMGSAWALRQWAVPHFVGADLWKFLQSPENWLVYLSVIVPMGIFNVVGSLQNIESADAAGDKYAPLPSLAANGIGTLAAAFLGSCFPTTIYIGHPGWKAMGARSGYSILNGLAIGAICLTGTVTLISRIIPLEAGVPIVLWIGVIIIAQAFMATPPEHSPAVAVGFFPAIAAWGATIVIGAFQQAQGRTLQQLFALPSVPSVQGKLAEVNGFLIHGMFVLERGFIFSCMILSALCVMLIDRRFAAAAIWSLVAAIFSFLGVMHAYQLSGNHVDFLFIGVPPRAGADCFPAWGIGACYVMFALIFWAAEWWVAKRDETLSGREREHP